MSAGEHIENKCQTIDNVESRPGLNVDHYIGKNSPSSNKKIVQSTSSHEEMLASLTTSQKPAVIKELFHTLNNNNKIRCCSDIFLTDDSDIMQMVVSYIQPILLKDDFIESHETIKFIDKAFLRLATKSGITSNPRHFASISIKAMKHLQMEKKPNLVYKFSQLLTLQKSGNLTEHTGDLKLRKR